jgi:hypothetical protein
LQEIQDFYARGHPNVLAEHAMTFEITKDEHLTRRGDCVIAVRATKGLGELSSNLRNLCKRDDARIVVELRASGIFDSIEGRGSAGLVLSHSSEIVGRKSTYVSDRTLMIGADKAACDINRDLVGALKSPDTKLEIRIIAEV